MEQVTNILFVDDEPQMLSALSRVFRGKVFNVITANSGAEGLLLIAEHQFDVIISDMRMPEMDGATFLATCAEQSPSSRRVLLTGYSDQESTVRAINDGKIHQFLTKPWDNQDLRSKVEFEVAEKQRLQDNAPAPQEIINLKEQVDSVSQELSQVSSFVDMAKDELLEQFNTTIKVISNLINMRLPKTDTMSGNVESHSIALAKLLKLDRKNITQISQAARLYQLGKLTLKDTLVNRCMDDLSPEETKEYNQHCITGADLLMPLNSLDYTAMIIRHQNENYDGTGLPHKLKGNKIPLGSRILRLTIDYQQLIHGFHFKDPLSSQDALSYIENLAGKKYDPTLCKIYQKLVILLLKTKAGNHYNDNLIPLDQLEAGQMVSRDLLNPEGMLLIAKNTELNDNMIRKLQNHASRDGNEINVFIMIPKTEDAPEVKQE
jgi:response regulator RpfG family c-di-GMP phosphodiesterase